MKLRSLLSVVFMCTSLASWRIDAESPSAAGADCSTLTSTNIDDCIRLNEIQVLGTHNSYHIAPAAPILALLGPRGRNIEYTHRPLTEQLAELGIRKFELDVSPIRKVAISPIRPRSVWSRNSTPPILRFASQASRCCTRRTSTTAPHASR